MLQPKNITHKKSSITLYPERWGVITSIRIHDTELLYQGMLADTLHDMTKSVRWGIPILFPNAGFLTDEEKIQSWYTLPQHGFARTNEWNILQESHNSITQSLSSSDVPDMFGYEWTWDIKNTITLSDEWIELIYSIANNSDNELPVSFGLHPYWNIPLWDKSAIEWNFAWGDIIASDIENWSTGGTTRIDVPSDGIVSFTIPWVGTIELQLSREFRRLWVWSLEGRDFVCVEPVMWDDRNIVKNPIRIPVGGKSESWVKIWLV
jgi:galactose mutarotase-like enzyme